MLPSIPKEKGRKFQQIMAVLKGYVRFIRNHAEHWEKHWESEKSLTCGGNVGEVRPPVEV